MKVIINFSEFDQVSLGNVNNKRVLTLVKNNSASYVQVPTCLDYNISNNLIEIFCNSTLEKNIAIFNIFQKTVNDIKNNISNLAKKKILLKGLGFRSTFDSASSTITFKLGYSHLNTLSVPEYIKNVKVKKNTILLESSDKILLGDYMKKIHQLKESDIYKGKGFSYKYDTKKLKIIKKSKFMTIKKDFLDFKEVINVMLKSGFLLSDSKIKNIANSKFFNVYYMLMSVKELIRNLKEVKNSNNGKIYLYIENRYLKSLAILLLNELTFAKNHVSIISLSRNIQKSSDNVSLLLVIGEVNEKFFLEATRSNLYLIHVINDSLRQPMTGVYNMSNNISDITKLVFIFALIDQVFVDSAELINKTNA